jgi:hypothetical protein
VLSRQTREKLGLEADEPPVGGAHLLRVREVDHHVRDRQEVAMVVVAQGDTDLGDGVLVAVQVASCAMSAALSRNARQAEAWG